MDGCVEKKGLIHSLCCIRYISKNGSRWFDTADVETSITISQSITSKRPITPICTHSYLR